MTPLTWKDNRQFITPTSSRTFVDLEVIDYIPRPIMQCSTIWLLLTVLYVLTYYRNFHVYLRPLPLSNSLIKRGDAQNLSHFENIRYGASILRVAPLVYATATVTSILSSLNEELDPVFTFPCRSTTFPFFLLENDILSFNPSRQTAAYRGRATIVGGRLDVPFIFFHNCLHTILIHDCSNAICISETLGINVLFWSHIE